MTSNLTQKLNFETDDLDSFSLVLASVIGATMPPIRNESRREEYDFLHVRWDAVSTGADQEYLLPQYSEFRNGNKFEKSEKPSMEPIALISRDRKDYDKLDEDFLSRWPKTPERETANAAGIAYWVKTCLENLPSDNFWAMCGRGFHEGFIAYDGSVSMGYGFKSVPSQAILVYRTHIYYGK